MMAIIEKHILDIVNNKDSIEAFYNNYLENDEDWNDYLEEIKNDRPLFDGYQYDYNMYKDEIINEIFGDVMKEQFFNNTIRALVEDLTDSDKINILKYLIGEALKPDCDITVNCISHQCYNDAWKSLMMDYVNLKVNSMILNEEGWLNSNVYRALNDCAFNKIQEIISREIAINKIKRNEIFNLGLGLKLSIKTFKTILLPLKKIE